MYDPPIAADAVGQNAPNGYKTDAAAFYHDPPLWVATSPINLAKQSVDFEAMRETVFRQRLETAIEVKVSREGLFAFSFADWPPGTPPPSHHVDQDAFERRARASLNRTLVMNTFLAFMYTNELNMSHYERDRMVVTPGLLISKHNLEDDGGGIASQRVSHLWSSHFQSTYNPFKPLFMDDRIISRHAPVSLPVIEKTVRDLTDVMRQGNDGLLLLDLALRASKAYQDHNYSLALIMNWAVSEKMLQELWRKYQEDNRERDGKRFITQDRAKRLQDGRTFTAAVISEVLSLTSHLDHSLYTDICKVRKARNEWMHSLIRQSPFAR